MGKKIIEEPSTSKKSGKEKEIQQEKSTLKHNKNKTMLPSDVSFFENYGLKIVKELGSGSFGKVYEAVCVNGNGKVKFAVKANYGTVKRAIIFLEINFLYLVRKKANFPRLQKVFMHQNNPYIVLNLFQSKPFTSYFHQFNMQDLKHYLIELLKGLKNLKDLGVYHRDIKPANFLYNPQKKTGILIDFGLSEIDNDFVIAFEQKANSIKNKDDLEYKRMKQNINLYYNIGKSLKYIGNQKLGTEVYMPLEALLKEKKQSYSSDIWPVGVIMLQTLLRKYILFQKIPMLGQKIGNQSWNYDFIVTFLIQLYIFFGDRVIQGCTSLGYHLKLPEKIQRVNIRDVCQIDGYNEQTEDLLHKLLQVDPAQRITPEDAIMHPFFDSVRGKHLRSSQWKNLKKEKAQKEESIMIDENLKFQKQK